MSLDYYRGDNTYVIWAEDSAWGTSGTPSDSNQIGKVQNVSITMTNNFLRTQGLGDGRNAQGAVPGAFDVTGSMDGYIDDPSWLKYMVGTVSGSGTVGAPYELQEQSTWGFTTGNIKPITLELGSDGTTVDDVLQIGGVVFNNLTLNLNEGEPLNFSVDFIGRSVLSSTTLETYTANTTRPFMFHNGNVVVGTDTFHLTSYSMTMANNAQTWRDLNSRFISLPAAGLRRYDFTLSFKYKDDTTGSTLSGTELRELFLGSSGATSPTTTANVSGHALELTITEGSATGDRVMEVELENCYFESWDQPIALDGGVFEVTVNGFGLAGKADGSAKVPIRWYTVS